MCILRLAPSYFNMHNLSSQFSLAIFYVNVSNKYVRGIYVIIIDFKITYTLNVLVFAIDSCLLNEL
jgi:hypothetical protein